MEIRKKEIPPERELAFQIWEKAKSDPQYAQMLRDLKPLEDRFEALLGQLPYEDQNIICDFVYFCEGMSWRMLEIACAYFMENQ